MGVARRRAGPREPVIVYHRSFLQSPGNQEELREILMGWEMTLVRKAQQRLAKDGDKAGQ